MRSFAITLVCARTQTRASMYIVIHTNTHKIHKGPGLRCSLYLLRGARLRPRGAGFARRPDRRALRCSPTRTWPNSRFTVGGTVRLGHRQREVAIDCVAPEGGEAGEGRDAPCRHRSGRHQRRRSFSAFRVATSRCNAASWKRAASPCPGSPSPALFNAKAALAVNIGFISPTVYELWRARDW